MKGLFEALQSSNKRDGVRGVTANLPLTDGFLHHGWFTRASVRMARGLDMFVHVIYPRLVNEARNLVFDLPCALGYCLFKA